MKIYKYFFLLASISFACTNIDDASLSSRQTFIHVYEGPVSMTASDVIEVIDGFLILGNVVEEDGSQVTVVVKTDLKGNQDGDIHYYGGGSGKAVKPFSNNNFTGYLIIGDSIKIDPNAAEVADIEIASARILALNQDLDSLVSKTFSDNNNAIRKTDIKGAAITIKEDGGIMALITYEVFGSTIKPWLISLNNDLTMDWDYQFSGLVRDFVSSKSIHHYNSNTIMASSLLRQQGNFNERYISVARVEDYLTENNTQFLGENLDRSFAANDIQPAIDQLFGFGIIGTSSETDGTKKNMFFTMVSSDGTLSSPPDTLFIDAALGETSSKISSIEDTGESLASTSDGGFILAGTMLTTATLGNGGRDIFLVKVNFSGDIVWKKLIGGVGDEVVNTVRETSDGGILICGTNTIGGYSTIFLIKTDRNGELKN